MAYRSNHRDFVEEIAKIRAMRRIWARVMRDKLGTERDVVCTLRFQVSQGAVGLNLMRSLPEANLFPCTLASFAGWSQSSSVEPMTAK